MLVLTNGQERTLEQHKTLFEKSGWKATKVTSGTYFLGGGQMIEAIPI